MQHSERVELWAGVSMLVVCLLIGGVEAASVHAAASTAYVAGWTVVFVGYLVAVLGTAVASTPRRRGRRVLLVVPGLVAAAGTVLLSPHRVGMAAILLVLVAALCAHHLGLRGLGIVVALNSVVIAAASAGLGPLVEGSARPAEIVLVVTLYALLQAGSGAAVWSQRQVASALADVSAAHVELRSTAALLAESSQAQERVRISRELHDVIGHQLTALALELEIATHRVDGPAHDHVVRARQLAKDLLGEVRTVVGTERHRAFDLEAALARIVDEVPRPQVHLEVTPGIEVDDEVATTLVRVVQEVTTNAIRHAQARHLRVSVTADADRVRLIARDDGVGAPPDLTHGNGLRGLVERVEALGGVVAVDGSDGFQVTVELPVLASVPA